MSRNIEAIFLDTGNTMRIVEEDGTFQHRVRQRIAELVGTQESPDAFCDRLGERYDAYKHWAKETLIQASEKELWTRWLLPDFPPEKIAPLAGKLTRLWIERDGRRIIRPDAKPTVIELSRRGYALGIIANTISETEIPDWLEGDGLMSYFKAIVLSSRFGRRKPDMEIYLEAARIAGVEPARCAYVGDNPSRDILGARQAGFGMVIILLEQATLKKEPPRGKDKPDGFIRTCSDLLNFFPPRNIPDGN